MVELYHAYKTYGRDGAALVDVSLRIEKGAFVYVTGPSGAGKTTFLRLLFGAESVTRGQVLVGGQNVARLEPSAIPYLRRNIGVVFQDFKLLPERTVAENVAFALEVLGEPQSEISRKVFLALKAVGLAHKQSSLPAKLSGGEQQRVAIARALVNDPALLLADEPTGNLDPELANGVMELLHEINLRGTTVVVATHDPALMERFPHRVIRLDAGRVVAS
jgi:cell division transport system ATP-binding protein